MSKEFICAVCDLTEKTCTCERYCGLCQSHADVRLCEDGLYYCRPCRESCELEAQYLSKG